MAAPLRLGVLDQSPIPAGSTGAEALANTVDLAQHAERLGYQRYWIAEHHGMPMLASPSPEVLIAAVAARTERLRVGSGGVMLPHYSPLKVAETFSMLSGLFPGRIDLGLGRAPGSDRETMFALQRDRRQPSPDDFPQQLEELLDYLEQRFEPNHPLARLSRLPGRPEAPEVWLLGSSAQSAIWAAELGLPYAFADFINPAGAELAQAYRRTFVASERLSAPRVAVAVSVICADSAEEAERLASSTRMAFALLRQGRLIEVPPVEEALRFLGGEAAAGLGLLTGRRLVVGTPETVREGLEQVAADYGAEDVFAVTITHDHGARRRSYELVAEAFGIRATGA